MGWVRKKKEKNGYRNGKLFYKVLLTIGIGEKNQSKHMRKKDEIITLHYWNCTIILGNRNYPTNTWKRGHQELPQSHGNYTTEINVEYLRINSENHTTAPHQAYIRPVTKCIQKRLQGLQIGLSIKCHEHNSGKYYKKTEL